MKYFTEETITSLQAEYKQFKSVQFTGLKDNPSLFKEELLILQSYNLIQLTASNIELAQWDTISPIKAATEVKILNIGDITSLLTEDKSLLKVTKTTAGIYIYIPSLHYFGIYIKETSKIVLNSSLTLNEPYVSRLLPELRYLKQTTIKKVIPNLVAERAKVLKASAASRKARGFTTLPKKGDKFTIRAYADMQKEFGEEVGSIAMENEDGELEPYEIRYINTPSNLYGIPFIDICTPLCGTTGTITSYDKTTGIIKATYSIAGKTVSTITTIPGDDAETMELEEPLIIHEQHIIKI